MLRWISSAGISVDIPKATERYILDPFLVYHLKLLPSVLFIAAGVVRWISCSASTVGWRSRTSISRPERLWKNPFMFHCIAKILLLIIGGGLAERCGVVGAIDEVVETVDFWFAEFSHCAWVGGLEFVLNESCRFEHPGSITA